MNNAHRPLSRDLQIARKLGLMDSDTPDYSLTDVKDEFDNAGCPIDVEAPAICAL